MLLPAKPGLRLARRFLPALLKLLAGASLSIVKSLLSRRTLAPTNPVCDMASGFYADETCGVRRFVVGHFACGLPLVAVRTFNELANH